MRRRGARRYDPSGQASSARRSRRWSRGSPAPAQPGKRRKPEPAEPDILVERSASDSGGQQSALFVVSSSLIASAGARNAPLPRATPATEPGPVARPQLRQCASVGQQGQDCQAGNLNPVQLADLQEMQNHMRRRWIGFGRVASSARGRAACQPSTRPCAHKTAAPYAADLPSAEADAADQLRQQAQQATSRSRMCSDKLGRLERRRPPCNSARPSRK